MITKNENLWIRSLYQLRLPPQVTHTLVFTILVLFSHTNLYSQLTPSDFGYQYDYIEFEKDTVHILISSKKGEEDQKKPVIFEIQGSTAVPLIVHNGQNITSSVSILQGFVESDYHLILINKPGLPLMCHQDSLTEGKYKDRKTNQYPEKYIENNNLEYYVRRNEAIINYLKQKEWVDTSKIVVQGHSEGSSIATHMTDKISGISHLIYSGGLPYFPRILAMIQQERNMENDTENPWVEKSFTYWKNVINNPLSLSQESGWNTNYGTYSFSQSENEILKRLRIPVLISFGTADEAAPFNDMFQIETIKDKRDNFTFKAYVGLDHYYQSSRHGDRIAFVVEDWLKWISKN